MDRRSLEDVESALADATFAEAVLPGDPNALATGLNTREEAAVVYEKTGHADKQKLMLEAAAKLVEQLGAPRYRDSVQSHWSRGWFFENTGNAVAAAREWEEMTRLTDLDAWFFEAEQLIHAGDLAGAKALAETARNKPFGVVSQCSAAIVLAESDPTVAKALIQTARTRGNGSPDDLGPPTLLLLLGNQAEADKSFRALRQRQPHWPWRGGWYERLLDFHCGDMTAQQLLARAGVSQFDHCEANFHIAMKYLGEGDRAQARKHFEASVDTGVFWFYEYQWCQTFLARMDQDPNWPRWIPDSTTQPSAN